jgi:hypothetical protein
MAAFLVARLPIIFFLISLIMFGSILIVMFCKELSLVSSRSIVSLYLVYGLSSKNAVGIKSLF